MGLVGKELTKYKLNLLSNLSTGGYHIMLDEEILSKKLQRQLPGSDIIYTEGPDPEELLDSMEKEKFRDYVISEIRSNSWF